MNIQKIVIAFKTIAKKEIIRILRIWPQTIIPPIITTSLYFLIFGQILFKDKILVISGENVTYSNYLIAGLVIMAIINSSYENASSSFFISRFHKNIEEMMVAPVPIPIIILGFAMGGVFRGLINGSMIFITAMLFNPVTIYSIGMVIITAFFTAMFFALAGIVNAIFAKNFDDISWFPAFILTPMVYLGGVFFSVDMLSDHWKFITKLNPIYHFVSFFRYNLLGVGEYLSISFVGIIVVNILVFIFAVSAFKYKMRK